MGSVPDAGARDDQRAAESNLDFVLGYFRVHGPGVLLVFIDTLVSQDRAGRMAYHARHDPELYLGVGVIGGTMLARAIASVFLGVGQPPVPCKLFPALAPALEWARARRAKEI